MPEIQPSCHQMNSESVPLIQGSSHTHHSHQGWPSPLPTHSYLPEQYAHSLSLPTHLSPDHFPTHAAPPAPRRPAGQTPALHPNPNPPSELELLHAEVISLHNQLASLTQPHPTSSSSALKSISPLWPLPKGPHSPFTLFLCSTPRFPSLHAIFTHPYCPVFICDMHHDNQPITSAFPPEDAEYICKPYWPPSSFKYYLVDTNDICLPPWRCRVHLQTLLTPQLIQVLLGGYKWWLYVSANCDCNLDVRSQCLAVRMKIWRW